jgi:putative Mg2+ transporter-C (MgtC) family protein
MPKQIGREVSMEHDLTWLDMLIRGLLATLLGLAIGWDREKKEKAAGLRTMAMVSLGGAGLVLITYELVSQFGGDSVRMDPIRVISGAAGGIGFLGAGAIIHSRGHVRGLTTAATIWVAAIIGLACGAGAFELAGVMCALVLAVLICVSGLKGRVLPEKEKMELEE